MNFAKVSGALGLLALGGITTPFAVAADTGWYGGVNVGVSSARIDDDRTASGLLGKSATATSISDLDRDDGFKLFGGYQFNPYFALEGGYFDLGDFGFTATTTPPGTLSGDVEYRGANLDAVGFLPLADRFSAGARIGLEYADAKGRFSGSGSANVSNLSRSKGDTNPKAGLGLQYELTQSLSLRAEAERYRIEDAVGKQGDIDLFSLGLVYRFGGKTPAPAPMAAAAPEPVAPNPPPPPPPAVVPPPPEAPMTVTFSAKVLFDFDTATVRPEGKQALDKFAADLKSANYDLITVKAVAAVTGHTDRIGSEEYNMRLSERRAEAVRDYLVQSAGIPASKIVVKGVDGQYPVTKPGECKGKTVTPALIACLQPDRRVEVELSK